MLAETNQHTHTETGDTATLSTTYRTWTAWGANPGLQDEEPVTEWQTYGTDLAGCITSGAVAQTCTHLKSQIVVYV
jgi:hypothetical protein